MGFSMEKRLGDKNERLGDKNERLRDKNERLRDKNERLGDKNERLGDKNERLGEKNGYSHPLFYGSFMWECNFNAINLIIMFLNENSFNILVFLKSMKINKYHIFTY